MPHATAEPSADRGPPAEGKSGSMCATVKVMARRSLLAARHPPVKNPEMIAFHASSFCRHPLTAQSNVENMPPQTPKFPPVTGARAFITDTAPTNRSPYKTSETFLNQT
jgi:hypothetical protein